MAPQYPPNWAPSMQSALAAFRPKRYALVCCLCLAARYACARSFPSGRLEANGVDVERLRLGAAVVGLREPGIVRNVVGIRLEIDGPARHESGLRRFEAGLPEIESTAGNGLALSAAHSERSRLSRSDLDRVRHVPDRVGGATASVFTDRRLCASRVVDV